MTWTSPGYLVMFRDERYYPRVLNIIKQNSML